MLWCVLPNVVMARGYFEGVAHRNDKGWPVTHEHLVHAGGDKDQHDPLSTDYGFVDCAPPDPRLVNVTVEQVVGEKFVLRWGDLQDSCVRYRGLKHPGRARVFYHGNYNRRLCSTRLSPTARVQTSVCSTHGTLLRGLCRTRTFTTGYYWRLCSTRLSPTATSADLRMLHPWNDFFGVYAELERVLTEC